MDTTNACIDTTDETGLLKNTDKNEGLTAAKPCYFPHRFRLFILLFFVLLLHAAIRSSFSITLIAMTNYTASHLNNVTHADRCPGVQHLNQSKDQSEGEFNWDSGQQSQLLSAFYYGYIVLQLPGGYISERIGGKRVILGASLLTGLLTLLGPLLARTSFAAFMAGRIMMGLVAGPLFSAIFVLSSKWAPTFEVTRLVSYANMGFSIGQITAFVGAAELIDSGFLGGWPSTFYVFGTLLLVWCVLWAWLAADSPLQDAHICQIERLYIEKNTGERDKAEYRSPPFRHIFTSPAVLSAWFVSFTDGYGYYILSSNLPMFMKQILGYDIKSSGILVSLQYSAQFVSGCSVPFVVDKLRQKQILSTKSSRLICTLIGQLFMAGTMLAIGLIFECDRTAVAFLLIVGQLVYGVQFSGYPLTALDIAPMFSGTIVGIGNSFTNASGFVAPIAVAWITGDSPSRQEWKYVFVSTSIVIVMGTLVYGLFMQGEELEWAKPTKILRPTQITATNKDVDDDNNDEIRILPNGNDIRNVHSIN